MDAMRELEVLALVITGSLAVELGGWLAHRRPKTYATVATVVSVGLFACAFAGDHDRWLAALLISLGMMSGAVHAWIRIWRAGRKAGWTRG